jgi:hypothetical protein
MASRSRSPTRFPQIPRHAPEGHLDPVHRPVPRPGRCGGQKIVFVRNPGFSSWSDAQPAGIPDSIVWRFGKTIAEPAKKVLGGDGDLSWFPPSPQDFADAASNHAGQFYVTPIAATFYSPSIPALHRSTTCSSAGAELRHRPTEGPEALRACHDHDLSGHASELPGYEAYCPYTRDPGTTWTAPDLETAQGLVNRSGTFGCPSRSGRRPTGSPRLRTMRVMFSTDSGTEPR